MMQDIATHPYPVIKPRLSLPSKPRAMKTVPPSKIATKPLKHRPNYRHTLFIAACQCLYASVSGAASATAWYELAIWPVYRVVALVVIAILWSNAASSAARKKSIDMLATVSIKAIRVAGKKRMESPALTEDTTTYLKAIKASFVEKSNEIH
jgi:hypothetical protein